MQEANPKVGRKDALVMVDNRISRVRHSEVSVLPIKRGRGQEAPCCLVELISKILCAFTSLQGVLSGSPQAYLGGIPSAERSITRQRERIQTGPHFR